MHTKSNAGKRNKQVDCGGSNQSDERVQGRICVEMVKSIGISVVEKLLLRMKICQKCPT